MLRQFNKKRFIETEAESRVRLHKSGKGWIKTTLASFGLMHLFKGRKAEERISEDNVDFVMSKDKMLKGALGVGTLLGGGVLSTPHVMADSATSILPVASAVGTALVDLSVVVSSTTNQTTTIASVSDTSSTSASQSQSTSSAQSKLTSTSTIVTSSSSSLSLTSSPSKSNSILTSSSLSTSTSTSLSNSTIQSIISRH
ncbi:hypothetical protein NC01_07595 [Streptococcus uberis]|nr:hypothetical protein NC01_07595 [Streptococcus uberis]